MKLHLLLTERPIAYYPALRKITGSITATIMLQQLLYWWDKRSGDSIHKTINDMEEETGLTRYEQDEAIKKLKRNGFISVERRGVPARRHFIVNVDAINEALRTMLADHDGADSATSRKLVCGNPANCVAGIQQTNTEITTETTSSYQRHHHQEGREVSANTDSIASGKLVEREEKQSQPSQPSAQDDDVEATLQRLRTSLSTEDLDELEAKLRQAAGVENDPSPALFDLSPILRLLAEGHTLDDIIAAIRALKARGKRIRSWAYLIPVMAERRITGSRSANAATSTSTEPSVRWADIIRTWAATGEWNEHLYGPPPGCDGCRVPSEWQELAIRMRGDK